MTNCKKIDEHLEDIDDCVFHIRKLAQSFDFPDDLEKKLNKLAMTMCFLSDEVEQWCDAHQYDDLEDANKGFNEIMDADIMGMLKSMRVR
jgi:hypothetical protein